MRNECFPFIAFVNMRVFLVMERKFYQFPVENSIIWKIKNAW